MSVQYPKSVDNANAFHSLAWLNPHPLSAEWSIFCLSFFPTCKYKCIFSNKDHCTYCVNIFYRFIFSVCLLSHVNIFHILYWLNCHSFECVYWNFPCNKRQHLNDLTCGLVILDLSAVHNINMSQKSLEKHMFYFYLLRHYYS